MPTGGCVRPQPIEQVVVGDQQTRHHQHRELSGQRNRFEVGGSEQSDFLTA